MIPPIENLAQLSHKEKLLLRLKHFLKIKVAAYSVSAATGLGVGAVTQSVERDITQYDPVAHKNFRRS